MPVLILLLALVPGIAAADILAVQCTIATYRSSYAPRPDTFTIQVDTDAGTITTYYGSMRMKTSRKTLRGVGMVADGWRATVWIDRKTGRLEAGTDRVEGRRYSYVDLTGSCILPPELRGQGYRPDTGR